jgi:hypothetical protein
VPRLPTQPEVLAIEEAHRAAQARLGIAGALLALRDWNGVSVSATVATGDAWLSRSLQMIRAINRKSMRLAKAYYQVARALETGYTLGVPEYSSDPKAVTMGGLRKQYLDLLLEVADLGKPATSRIVTETDPDERWLEQELENAEGQAPNENATITFANTEIDSYIQDMLDAADSKEHPDNEPIPVDTFDWQVPDLTLEDIRNVFAEELTAAADERAAKIAKLREDETLTAKQAFDKADKLHEAAGVVNAGLVDQAGIDAGRDLINYAAGKDRRVMMWARGTGPNPCAFCAMLASRGFAYTSKARAMTTKGGVNEASPFGGAEVRSYHPNCHCYPVIRWVDIPDPTAPGRNAHYEALWKAEIRDKRIPARGTKNDTLNHWRRIIAKERRDTLDAIRKAANTPTA